MIESRHHEEMPPLSVRGVNLSERQKRPSELIEEVLDERAQSISLSPDEIEAGVVRLHRQFLQVREQIATRRESDQAQQPMQPETGRRRLRYEAILRPGTYRLSIGDLKFKVVLGEMRRTSRIVIDAARDLLSPGGGEWGIGPAAGLATRDGIEDHPFRVEIAQKAGPASGTVIADDTGDQSRVLVVIRGFPADTPVPVIELGEESLETESVQVTQVNPEISLERPVRTRPRG